MSSTSLRARRAEVCGDFGDQVVLISVGMLTTIPRSIASSPTSEVIIRWLALPRFLLKRLRPKLLFRYMSFFQMARLVRFARTSPAISKPGLHKGRSFNLKLQTRRHLKERKSNGQLRFALRKVRHSIGRYDERQLCVVSGLDGSIKKILAPALLASLRRAPTSAASLPPDDLSDRD